jgi:hypothetical protein
MLRQCPRNNPPLSLPKSAGEIAPEYPSGWNTFHTDVRSQFGHIVHTQFSVDVCFANVQTSPSGTLKVLMSHSWMRAYEPCRQCGCWNPAPSGEGGSARRASAACSNLQVYLISIFHSSLSPNGTGTLSCWFWAGPRAQYTPWMEYSIAWHDAFCPREKRHKPKYYLVPITYCSNSLEHKLLKVY